MLQLKKNVIMLMDMSINNVRGILKITSKGSTEVNPYCTNLSVKPFGLVKKKNFRKTMATIEKMSLEDFEW